MSRRPSSLGGAGGIPTSSPFRFSRRRFVAVASAATVVAGADGLSWGAAPIAAERSANLSVGYVAGSDAFPYFSPLPWHDPDWPGGPLQIVPAAQEPLGDQNLAGTSVAIHLHGVYPCAPERQWRPVRSATLVTFFPSFDPLVAGPLPFFAWGCRRRPRITDGAPVRFPVPLRRDGGLELVLEVMKNVTAVPGSLVPATRMRTSLYTDFTVDWDRGRPKLRRGIYLLALGETVWDEPLAVPPSDEDVPAELTSVVISVEPLPEE
jgi:hypothetical protein